MTDDEITAVTKHGERMNAIAAQQRLFPGRDTGPPITLPEICLAVRSSFMGVIDQKPTEEFEEIREMLSARFDTWEKNHYGLDRVSESYCEFIDIAVKSMVASTIALITYQLANRVGKKQPGE